MMAVILSTVALQGSVTTHPPWPAGTGQPLTTKQQREMLCMETPGTGGTAHNSMSTRHITAYPQYQSNGQPAELQGMKATRCLVSCVQHTPCTHIVRSDAAATVHSCSKLSEEPHAALNCAKARCSDLGQGLTALGSR